MTENITVTRTFRAPRELVYEAWTRPEHFSAWFGTAAVEVPLDTLAMDVRVGGEWRAVMHLPDGNLISWVGEYTEVDPPSRLAFTINDHPANQAGAPVTVDFTEVAEGTEMTMTQVAGDFTPEQIEQTILGYNAFFDDMERIIADGTAE